MRQADDRDMAAETTNPLSHRFPSSPNAVRWFAVLLCLVVIAASDRAFAQSRVILGPGDSVRVTVFQNPDLATEARISERGTLAFPLIGEIALGGLAPSEAAARIAEQLVQGKFVVNPQVSVNVVDGRSRQVSILGQVARPGRYVLDGVRTNLTDMLALAGGISAAGDDNITLMVQREGKTQIMQINVPAIFRTGDLSQDVELQAGDTIFVPRAANFYIYGEVQRPGAYRLEPAMTVMQALSVGGGVTPRGTERGVKVNRRIGDEAVRKLEVSLNDRVQPGDVIYVAERLF
jgi:polysaccharide export outer membrane protein